MQNDTINPDERKAPMQQMPAMKPMQDMQPMAPMREMPRVPSAAGSDAWWPRGLGAPASSGAQGELRYAFFPQERRLAIERRGRVTQYDTADHRISGVSQQRAGAGGLPRFSSQHGAVDLALLRQVG